MRKVISICLAIFCLVASSHVTLRMHHCLGKLQYVSLINESDSCCASVAEMPCCEDQFITISDESETKLLSQYYFEFDSFEIVDVRIGGYYLPLILTAQGGGKDQIGYSPPYSSPLYVLYSSLIFYA